MDFVLETADTFVFDRVYANLFPKAIANVSNLIDPLFYSADVTVPALYSTHMLEPAHVYTGQPFLFEPSDYINRSWVDRTNVWRQFMSLFLAAWIGAYILYFLTAGLSYLFVYDKRNFDHPKFLKNQVRLEIMQSVGSIPLMTLYTVPWFLAEVRGYSRMYWQLDQYGSWYFWLQFPLFLMFTDCGIYVIHRMLHWRYLYKYIHKPHHKWVVPTPFASHAFHSLDGYAQSLPYHIFPFLFPIQKVAFLVLFVGVNIWSVMIHDGEYLSNNPVVNGSANHTIHHLYFNYNYGQYTTLWDRLGGSHRAPDPELFDRQLKMSNTLHQKQARDFEDASKENEDIDDREYAKKNQ